MKTNSMVMTGALLLGLAGVQIVNAAEEFAPRNDGFIRDWLMLAPIQLESDSNGGDAIDKNQLPEKE